MDHTGSDLTTPCRQLLVRYTLPVPITSPLLLAIEEPADKIVFPDNVEPQLAATHKVVWSDIDTMAHVNNVRYVCWALDAVSRSILQDNPLKEIIVNYDAEVLLGEEVQLYRIMQPTNEGLIVYIQGRVEDKPKFCVKMVF